MVRRRLMQHIMQGRCVCCCVDTVNFLGISIVGQSNKGGDGGIYVGSIMKGLVSEHIFKRCILMYSVLLYLFYMLPLCF